MLLREVGFEFTTIPSHVDESFASDMDVMQVPALLAGRKADFVASKHPESITLASDTIVVLRGAILNKPVDREDAVRMLEMLSGVTHTVVTAVCINAGNTNTAFNDVTQVTFRKLSLKEIESYVDNFSPLDKAGAYGAQECLPPGLDPCSKEERRFLASIDRTSLIRKSMNHEGAADRLDAIQRLNGSYFNVMGLPIHLVYAQLKKFHA